MRSPVSRALTIDVDDLAHEVAQRYGSATPDTWGRFAQRYGTPGFAWDVFSADADEVLAAAAAAALAAEDRQGAVNVMSTALVAAWTSGHREVSDTEPRGHVQDFLVAACRARTWAPIEVGEVYAATYALQADTAASRREAAIAILIARHRSEFDALLAAGPATPVT